VRSCDSRRLPISGPIGKSCSGVAQDRFAARPPICRLCGERLNDARAWLAKATTGKRASHHSRQDKQEPIGLVQTSARSGLELSQQGPAVVVTKLSPLGCRSGVQSRRLKSGDWRSLSRPTRRRALQQIEDPARRTRSAAQRRRGSRPVGIRSGSVRSTNVHANRSQPIANNRSRSSVRSRHCRREGNSKRAVRRAQRRPPGRG
jgi:hypothetical protein